MKKFFLCLFLILICPYTLQAKSTPHLVNIRHWETNDFTRVVLYTSRTTQFQCNELSGSGNHPKRFYCDLYPMILGGLIKDHYVGKGTDIKSIRAGQFDKQTVRVVIDLAEHATAKAIAIFDPFRIIIDVNNAIAVTQQGRSEQKPASKSLRMQQKYTIVLDPGHGGRDYGARSLDGLAEKDLTLAIAQYTKQELEHMAPVDVILTRKTDMYIPLEARPMFANSQGAHVFVSIHINAHTDTSQHGISTYILNNKHQRYSRRLASVENKMTFGQLDDLELMVKDVQRSLLLPESQRLAQFLHDGMLEQQQKAGFIFHDAGNHHALFYVLVGARMPAALVECGFLSNREDYRKLQTKQVIVGFAKGLATGILKYLK